MSSKYPLTGYGLMAKRHWTEFCPQMVEEMEGKGTLMEALYEAQEATLDEMEALPGSWRRSRSCRRSRRTIRRGR